MIAVDWGTTSLRLYRLDARGTIVEQRRSAAGILACGRRFEEALADQIAGWDDRLIVAAGMIGSRQGWREVPYVECPASPIELAAGLEPIDSSALTGRSVWIVPGLSIRTADAMDVMRGEETQICGIFDQLGAGQHLVCLPGTHSKWVEISGGRIERFWTAMTGEVFQVLREHSLLGRLMEGEAYDEEGFVVGLTASGSEWCLLRQLFGVRTAGLSARLASAQLASYLSGLLIGSELRDLPPGIAQTDLVGADHLTAIYARALAQRGVMSRRHAETATAVGLHDLAKRRGLIA